MNIGASLELILDQQATARGLLVPGSKRHQDWKDRLGRDIERMRAAGTINEINQALNSPAPWEEPDWYSRLWGREGRSQTGE